MKKAFNRFVKLIILLVVGFFVIQSNWVQEELIPDSNQLFLFFKENFKQPTSLSQSSESLEKEGKEISTAIIISREDYCPAPETIDEEQIRSTIMQLTNDLRKEMAVEPLTQNEQLEKVAMVRARETEESFSHTRPDDRDFYTALNESGSNYFYSITGENLAMATHHLKDVEMAKFLFDGWVESPGHYQNMIKPEYKEIGIGIYYDGEILYAVQTFGTPL